MRTKYISIWIAFLLLILLTGSSFQYLSLWFMSDDMPLIHAAITKSTLSMFFDRETNLSFHKFFYTPLFPIPFKIDWHLFKLNPTGYHIHNLIVVFLTSLIAYKVLTLYIPSFNAWIGSFLFALSYPNITNIGWITRKHYIWGTFLVLLSFYIFKKSEKLKNNALYVISLILYLGALFFKEAFAPMPAAIFILSSGNLKSRFMKSLPFFIVLGTYFLLRFYFIGGLGGYIYIQAAGFDIAALLKQSTFNISYVISVIWGIKWIFLAIISIFLLLNIKRAWIFLTLFLIWVSPFMLLRVSPSDFNVFYYPSKFTIPVFIISSLVAYSSKKAIKAPFKFIIYCLIGIIFLLQISNINRAQDVIVGGSNHFKKVAHELKEKIRDDNVFIVDSSPWFFSHYYDILNLLKTNDLKGTLVTTNEPVVPILEPYLKNSRFVYLNGTWHDVQKQPLNIKVSSNDSLPPLVEISYDPPFFKGEITDNMKGEYVFALLNFLTPSNVLCQSGNVPQFLPVKAGLLRDREELYIYRKKGETFSQPYIIKLP